MIPLLLESGFRASDWLGLITGSKLYFDFSCKKQYHNCCEKKFEASMGNLIRELGDRGKRSEFVVSGKYHHLVD